MLFYLKNIDTKIIDNIIFTLENKKFVDCSDNTYTVNGFQTNNIINIFSKEILKEMVPYENLYEKIFHIHYINYFNGGYQEKHSHEKTEKFSFILYLNDSDGETVFENPVYQTIIPKKGTLVLFDSKIIHYAEKSFKSKKILVGAICKNENNI